jgi:hypothetical protein
VTINLDDDVNARMRLEMQRTGKSLKQVTNEFLRLGFKIRTGTGNPRPLGLAKGRVKVGRDFFKPLPDSFRKSFQS